jgi:CheY-like chemotaxis protein
METVKDSRRVLIVDDNEDAANSLAMLLELSGHETASVYSAADALTRVAVFRPDIVLLDIGLPGMDGYEVAQQIRELPGLGGIRLIAVTGYGRLEDRQRAREAGFDDHLVKPVDLTVLEQKLTGHRADRGA